MNGPRMNEVEILTFWFIQDKTISLIICLWARLYFLPFLITRATAIMRRARIVINNYGNFIMKDSISHALVAAVGVLDCRPSTVDRNQNENARSRKHVQSRTFGIEACSQARWPARTFKCCLACLAQGHANRMLASELFNVVGPDWLELRTWYYHQINSLNVVCFAVEWLVSAGIQ